jgi:NAD dependent epimerase/dehydratase family enzyme
MTISNDVADGNSYPIWGATYSKTLQPGQFDMFVNLAGGTVQAQVTSTTKNILITGTAGDTFGYMVLFG